jgi:hypothetical protein
MWKWRYYAGAAILVGALLIGKAGVPPAPVIAGLLGVGMFMRRRASRLS